MPTFQIGRIRSVIWENFPKQEGSGMNGLWGTWKLQYCGDFSCRGHRYIPGRV